MNETADTQIFLAFMLLANFAVISRCSMLCGVISFHHQHLSDTYSAWKLLGFPLAISQLF